MDDPSVGLPGEPDRLEHAAMRDARLSEQALGELVETVVGICQPRRRLKKRCRRGRALDRGNATEALSAASDSGMSDSSKP